MSLVESVEVQNVAGVVPVPAHASRILGMCYGRNLDSLNFSRLKLLNVFWKWHQKYFGSILAHGVSKHTVYSQEFYNNVGQNRWEISDTCLAQ